MKTLPGQTAFYEMKDTIEGEVKLKQPRRDEMLKTFNKLSIDLKNEQFIFEKFGEKMSKPILREGYATLEHFGEFDPSTNDVRKPRRFVDQESIYFETIQTNGKSNNVEKLEWPAECKAYEYRVVFTQKGKDKPSAMYSKTKTGAMKIYCNAIVQRLLDSKKQTKGAVEGVL